jgi:hypothetical protein
VGVLTVSILNERFVIYTALVLLCSIASVFLSMAAGLWSFLQIAAVIELLYWIGLPASRKSEQL